MPITPALAKPIIRTPELAIKAWAVMLFLTSWKISSTPLEKIVNSCASAPKPLITLIPFKDSVKRPETSALFLPLSLKIGRI